MPKKKDTVLVAAFRVTFANQPDRFYRVERQGTVLYLSGLGRDGHVGSWLLNRELTTGDAVPEIYRYAPDGVKQITQVPIWDLPGLIVIDPVTHKPIKPAGSSGQ